MYWMALARKNRRKPKGRARKAIWVIVLVAPCILLQQQFPLISRPKGRNVVDAKDRSLGRVAVTVANLLRGKGKAIFTPRLDTGDFVIVINAEKVRLTGKKEVQKKFTSFSGFVGGHKSESAGHRRERSPELLIEHAVKGMIPHNRLGRALYTKLKVYKGDRHPHEAQQPIAVS